MSAGATTVNVPVITLSDRFVSEKPDEARGIVKVTVYSPTGQGAPW